MTRRATDQQTYWRQQGLASCRHAALLLLLVILPALAADYTVQPGDTLYRIATRELGSGARWNEIARANNLLEPYAIQVGQILILPNQGDNPTIPTTTRPTPPPPTISIVAETSSDQTPLQPEAMPLEALLPAPPMVRDLIPETSLMRAVSAWPDALRPVTDPGERRVLDLATAVAEALERSGEIRAAIANRAVIEAQIKVVASSLLPQVNATATGLRYETGKSIAPSTALDEYSYAGDVSLTQSIYSFGRIPAALRAAYAERAAATAAVEEARHAVRYRVEAAFLGLLLAREHRLVAHEALEVAEALHLRARVREEAGVGTRFDVTRAEADRAAMLARIVEEEARVEMARERLAVAMGLAPSAPVDANGTLGSTARPVPPERARTLAEDRRPDLVILRHRIASSEAVARYERAQSLPSIDFMASANYTRHDYVRPATYSPWRDASNAYAGVVVSVPIFDGFRARHAARGQDAMTSAMKAGYDEVRHAALLELRAVYYDLGAASEKLSARASGVHSAEEALRMAQFSFAAGRVAALDVIQSSYVLADARRGEAEARHDYHLGLCRLVRATGAPESVEGEFK